MRRALITGIGITMLGLLVFRYRWFVINKSSVSTTLMPTMPRWPWPEYPEHFQNVDCAIVPDRTISWPPGNDVLTDLRTVCWKERVWYENNPQLCANLWNKDNCYTWMAIKLKDESLCSNEKVDATTCKQRVKENATEDTWMYQVYVKKNRNPL